MTKISNVALGTAAACIALALGSATPARAAFLSICDASVCGSADPLVTFSTNDFEGTFQINSVVVQSGLGNPNVTSVSEGTSGNPVENDFAGVWILGGPITAENETIFFDEKGGGISDVLHFTYSQDSNGFGHLDGFIMSDTGADIDPAFLASRDIVDTGTTDENGVFDFSNANITANFQSDVEAPEPMSLALFGGGLVAFGVRRRWQKKRTHSRA